MQAMLYIAQDLYYFIRLPDLAADMFWYHLLQGTVVTLMFVVTLILSGPCGI